MTRYEESERPRFLIGTTNLLGTVCTLTAARYLIQVEHEWLQIDEQQGQKRISRLTQTRETYAEALYSKGSNIEEVIGDVQSRRAKFLELSYDPKTVEGRKDFEEDTDTDMVDSEDEAAPIVILDD